MFYGQTTWDPKLILAQIICLQCLSYTSYGLIIWLIDGVFGIELSLAQYFSHNVSDYFATSVAWLINSVFCAVFLSFVVERTKKCLDFAFTIIFTHFVVCTLYDGFPTNYKWWLLHLVTLVIMTVLGEYLCMRRELQDIQMSDFLSINNGNSAKNSGEATTTDGTLEETESIIKSNAKGKTKKARGDS